MGVCRRGRHDQLSADELLLISVVREAVYLLERPLFCGRSHVLRPLRHLAPERWQVWRAEQASRPVVIVQRLDHLVQ